METPTIIKRTKRYLLVKIPLPQAKRGGVLAREKTKKLTADERHILKIIEEGERDYKGGRTIQARSTNEALNIYEQRKHASY